MNAHLITIGDEILIGQIMNTNARDIGEMLTNIQIDVKKHSVVGDVEEDILQEFERVWAVNDLVIVTGGLGPTHDDITRSCVVKFFNTELVTDNDVLDDIKKMFEVRGWTIDELNEDQAKVPAAAIAIRNSLGTAPGMWIEKNNKIFVCMPGVPFEMMGMMENFVIPQLQDRFIPKTIKKRLILQTTGIAESTLFQRLGNINELLEGAKMAFLPNQYGVKLRITAEGKNNEEAGNKLTEIEQKIRSKAGRYIYSKGEESLENVISRLLKERDLKISIAESCTGGLVCNLLTNISGSSNYFERGIISYSNGSKVEILKVNEDDIAEHGAVSSEVAMQMAEGVKAISGTDIGIGITGILGPTGGSKEKPVGTVYIGICDDKVCTFKKFQFGEDRILNKQRAAQAALDVLRRNLLGINIDD